MNVRAQMSLFGDSGAADDIEPAGKPSADKRVRERTRNLLPRDTPMETYPKARVRLLNELEAKGWYVKKSLKVPQAISPDGQTHLFFRPQAVHLDDHSLFLDIRDMTVGELIQRAR